MKDRKSSCANKCIEKANRQSNVHSHKSLWNGCLFLPIINNDKKYKWWQKYDKFGNSARFSWWMQSWLGGFMENYLSASIFNACWRMPFNDFIATCFNLLNGKFFFDCWKWKWRIFLMKRRNYKRKRIQARR